MKVAFPWIPNRHSLHVKKREHHPPFITSDGKTQITVLICCNAARYSIPPLVIFNRKILKQELTQGEVGARTTYGLTKSGWVDS